ncbi:unnamed protein product [Musa banksii]
MGCGRSFWFMQLVFVSILLVPTLSSSSGSDREALEIGIGVGVGGGAAPSTPQPECPPPPPRRQPQPSDFENILQHRAYFVIQRFKQTITCDPKNKTGSWMGFHICNNDGRGYQGFYCETPPGLNNMRTIASVNFNGFTLSAPTVCGFVDQLPDLALFHANSNSFGGTVPALANLPFFYELDLSNNCLSGGFPASVLPLVDLAFLDLRYNGYAGPVPSVVFLIRTWVHPEHPAQPRQHHRRLPNPRQQRRASRLRRSSGCCGRWKEERKWKSLRAIS